MIINIGIVSVLRGIENTMDFGFGMIQPNNKWVRSNFDHHIVPIAPSILLLLHFEGQALVEGEEEGEEEVLHHHHHHHHHHCNFHHNRRKRGVVTSRRYGCNPRSVLILSGTVRG